MGRSFVADDSNSGHSHLLTKYCGLEFIDLNPPYWKFKIENELLWNDIGDEIYE